MSLDNRVIAALGAVVVIGAGTLGGSIAYASSQPTPQTNVATVTVGRDSHRYEPSCYNGGKPLDQAANAKCNDLFNNPSKMPQLQVKSVDRIGVGVTTGAADNGWQAYTNGGASGGNVSVARFQKGNTFSGMTPATNVLSQVRDTTLTIVEVDGKTSNQQQPGILAVWFINLTNDANPVGSPQSMDSSQGQSQGQ